MQRHKGFGTLRLDWSAVGMFERMSTCMHRVRKGTLRHNPLWTWPGKPWPSKRVLIVAECPQKSFTGLNVGKCVHVGKRLQARVCRENKRSGFDGMKHRPAPETKKNNSPCKRHRELTLVCPRTAASNHTCASYRTMIRRCTFGND